MPFVSESQIKNGFYKKNWDNVLNILKVFNIVWIEYNNFYIKFVLKTKYFSIQLFKEKYFILYTLYNIGYLLVSRNTINAYYR